MEFLDGKKLQKQTLQEIKNLVELLEIKPTLAVISIGEDPINNVFFQQKKKMCQEVGFKIILHHYEDISESSLISLIKKLNCDDDITSILLEMPIPSHLSLATIRNTILPEKDIEGVTTTNQMKVQTNSGGFIPCTALGIINLLTSYNIDVKEKNIVIINRSELIGKPLFHMFLKQDATITLCHRQTKNLKNYLKDADIVISATGSPYFLTTKDFKENSIVIDAGMSEEEQKIVGDIDFDSDENLLQYAVRPIGGVGPMTIAAIAENILKSYYLQSKNKYLDEFE